MSSQKVQKYLKQYSERNYTFKARKLEKNDIREYCHRSKSWQTPEASGSDSLLGCGEKQEEKIGENHGETRIRRTIGRCSGREERTFGRNSSSEERQEERTDEREKETIRRDGEAVGQREICRRQEDEIVKDSEKKKVISHIKKDDKEFRQQIKEDVKLKKELSKKRGK